MPAIEEHNGPSLSLFDGEGAAPGSMWGPDPH